MLSDVAAMELAAVEIFMVSCILQHHLSDSSNHDVTCSGIYKFEQRRLELGEFFSNLGSFLPSSSSSGRLGGLKAKEKQQTSLVPQAFPQPFCVIRAKSLPSLWLWFPYWCFVLLAVSLGRCSPVFIPTRGEGWVGTGESPVAQL